jgi:hypothetical protein
LASGTRTWQTLLNNLSQLDVGNLPDGLTANGWNGPISEIIYYPWSLTNQERNRVESYLAIKHGLTLDQTTATNYIASDATTKMWDAALNTNFKFDITGIGRDDCGTLRQKQSTSTDAADIISMGLGAIAVNNDDNANDFATDKTFMSWAHNNAVNSFSNFNVDVPASLTAAGGCYLRLNRVWHTQVVNTLGVISMEAGKNGIFNFNTSTYKPVLLMSSSPTSFVGATIINADSVKRGKAYFSNLTIQHNMYFSFAFIVAAPGGVTTNLSTWFDAGSDVYTDVAQTVQANIDNELVVSMNNISFGAAANFKNVEQTVVARQPKFKTAQFNFNPSVLFDGVDDVLLTPANINTTDYRNNTSMTSILSGANYGTGNVFWYHDDNAGTNKTALERPQAFWGSGTALSRNPSLTVPEIYTYSNTVGTGWTLYSNLTTVGSGNTNNTSTATPTGLFKIGSNVNGAGAGANFDLGEFVIYKDDKGASSTSDMRKIHSYMAIKYGFTLDQTAMATNYYTSDNTGIYNYATYWNRITGIGRDDCSALEQRQSKSIDAGALVTISHGTTLAASNIKNTTSFSANKSYNVFGDNNKSITWTGVDNLDKGLVRLNRVWHLKETGTVGTVYIEVPGNSSALITKLPASNTANDPVYMIVAPSSSNGSFKGAVTYIEMTPDVPGATTKWKTTYDFADGDYYTFATLKLCIAPGGISEGLTAWYKSDNKTLGAIAPTTGTVVDDAFGANTLTRNGSGTATVVAGSVNSFNYNRAIALTGNATISKSALSENSIFTPNTGAMYAVANGNTFPLGFARASYNAAVLNAAGGNWANIAGAGAGTFTAGIPNILNINKTATTLTGGTNGTTASIANSTPIAVNATHSLYLGAGYVGATLTFNNASVAEAFTYSRDLTAAEINV